jgi:hypothetical protein
MMGGFEKDPEIICSPSFHQRELTLVEGRSVPPGTDREGEHMNTNETNPVHAKTSVMNPQRFLLVGGCLLVTIGLLGIINVLGTLSSAAFFHPPSWINWLHLSFGTVAPTVGLLGSSKRQVGFTFFGAILLNSIGLLGLLVYAFGLLGLHAGAFVANPQIAAEFADPSDHIVYLAVGLLALWGWITDLAD